MKPVILMLFVFLLCSSIAGAQQRDTIAMQFESNRFIPSVTERFVLEGFYERYFLEKAAGRDPGKILINGHTDAVGTQKANMVLSEKRAKATADFLIRKGIGRKNIQIKFYGAAKPAADNGSEAGRQQNRRVEIIVSLMDPVLKAGSVADFYARFKKNPQLFTVSAEQDIFITGREKTELHIPKNAFRYQDGRPVTGMIEIRLTEYYKLSDMLKAGLHTLSDDKPLETGGMIYLSASASGEDLRFKDGPFINWGVPKFNDMYFMQAFTGEFQNENLNWRPVDSNYLKKRSLTKEETASGIKVNEGYDKGFYKVTKLDNLLIQTYRLGWINCDRFINIEPKTDLIVKVNGFTKPEVKLILKDIKGIIPALSNTGNQYFLKNLPEAQKATLIAFSYVNGEPYFASKEIVISKDHEIDLKLVKTTFSALKKTFETFD